MTHLQNFAASNPKTVWTLERIASHLSKLSEDNLETNHVSDWISEQGLDFPLCNQNILVDEHQRPAKKLVLSQLCNSAAISRGAKVLFIALYETELGEAFLFTNDESGERSWIRVDALDMTVGDLDSAMGLILEKSEYNLVLVPTGQLVAKCRMLLKEKSDLTFKRGDFTCRIALEVFSHGHDDILAKVDENKRALPNETMTHLDRLEAEAIHIIREVVAEADNPVMLYSVGKDSAVMLHLARKAFYPSVPPFPLLHVDTRWKFQAMYDFRDYMARESGMDLLVHVNPDAIEQNINPFDHGSALHTDITKTQGLKQALDQYKFDVAFGGARRDEEKSRAKERVFSFRTRSHRWDPKNQRPELWHQYNARKNPGESIRCFPISNWTELDIWQYIYREQIPIVPLYFAQERPVVERDGMLMMVDDDRLPLKEGEQIMLKKIRFRTLGCYPLTGAIESDADDLASIVLELLSSKTSERQGRAIDSDSSASMEKKKQEGYF